MAIVFGWQLLFPPQAGAAVGGRHRNAPAPRPRWRRAASRARRPLPARGRPVPAPDAPEELVTLEGRGFTAVLSSHGGASPLELHGHKFQRYGGRQAGAHRHGARGHGAAAAARRGGLAGAGRRRRSPARPGGARRHAGGVEDATASSSRAAPGGREEELPAHRQALRAGLELELRRAGGRHGRACSTPASCPPPPRSGGFFSGPPLDFVRPGLPRRQDHRALRRWSGDEEPQSSPGRWPGPASTSTTSSRCCSRPSRAGPACSRRAARRGAPRRRCQYPSTRPAQAGLHALRRPQAARPAPAPATGRAGFDTAIDYGPVTNFFAFFARDPARRDALVRGVRRELGRRHHPADRRW